MAQIASSAPNEHATRQTRALALRAGISDMGSESTQTECDLLSRVPSDDNPVDQVPSDQRARHVLPKDLPKATMHLNDEELGHFWPRPSLRRNVGAGTLLRAEIPNFRFR
jgi:hypothetical protein